MVKIISIIDKKANVTVKDIAQVMEITETKVQRRLKTLQDQIRIKRVGSKKTGYWEIKR